MKIKEVDEADDIFTKLMGDVVEPRREFIQDNSLSANRLTCEAVTVTRDGSSIIRFAATPMDHEVRTHGRPCRRSSTSSKAAIG